MNGLVPVAICRARIRSRAPSRARGLPLQLNQWRKRADSKTGQNKGLKMSQIDKAAVRQKFQRHEGDTGSSEVQIAMLSKRIESLTGHLKTHKKDVSSRYGLIRMVSARRKLLDYLKRKNEAGYQKIIKELGIRR